MSGIWPSTEPNSCWNIATTSKAHPSPPAGDGEASLAAINGFHSYKCFHQMLSWGKKGEKKCSDSSRGTDFSSEQLSRCKELRMNAGPAGNYFWSVCTLGAQGLLHLSIRLRALWPQEIPSRKGAGIVQAEQHSFTLSTASTDWLFWSCSIRNRFWLGMSLSGKGENFKDQHLRILTRKMRCSTLLWMPASC